MKVVLTKDVKDLGRSGQVKEVSDGYARNFLFPRKLAVPATESALRQVEAREKAAARRLESETREAQRLAERLKSQPLKILTKVGEQGRLYGSVTAADIESHAVVLIEQFEEHTERRSEITVCK